MNANHKLIDKSQDAKYFTINPRIVKYYSRSPYDYALWDTVKEIAGESRECFLSTEDLAILSGMSAGKVSECRKYWIEIGFLEGELRRDPGYPQPVWHLSIPDLWMKNMQWAESHLSIASRVEFKKSLHQMKPSPGEEGIPPGEEGIPPGETKKKEKKEKKESNNGDENHRAALLAGMPAEWKMLHGESVSQDDLDRANKEKFKNEAQAVAQAICHNMADGEPLAVAFMLTRGILLDEGSKSGHRKALRQMLEAKPRQVKPEHVSQAVFDLKSKNLTVKDLFSVMGTAIDLANPMPGSDTSEPAERLETL